ncbi:MAG: ATP-binding protein, partial [Candidatus Omnitrophota bacterium]
LPALLDTLRIDPYTYHRKNLKIWGASLEGESPYVEGVIPANPSQDFPKDKRYKSLFMFLDAPQEQCRNRMHISQRPHLATPYHIADNKIYYHGLELTFAFKRIESSGLHRRFQGYFFALSEGKENQEQELRLNPINRVRCPGACAFCQRMSLHLPTPEELDSQFYLSPEEIIEAIADKEGADVFKRVGMVSVITADFDSENKVIEYMQRLKTELEKYAFAGELYITGTEVTSGEGMMCLHDEIGVRTYLYALETFSRRVELMHAYKARPLEEVYEILGRARDVNFESIAINYIGGLEPVNEFRKGMEELARERLIDAIGFNMFTSFSTYQDTLRVPESFDVSYWLELERIIRESGIEIYRPYFYGKGNMLLGSHDEPSSSPAQISPGLFRGIIGGVILALFAASSPLQAAQHAWAQTVGLGLWGGGMAVAGLLAVGLMCGMMVVSGMIYSLPGVGGFINGKTALTQSEAEKLVEQGKIMIVDGEDGEKHWVEIITTVDGQEKVSEQPINPHSMFNAREHYRGIGQEHIANQFDLFGHDLEVIVKWLADNGYITVPPNQDFALAYAQGNSWHWAQGLNEENIRTAIRALSSQLNFDEDTIINHIKTHEQAHLNQYHLVGGKGLEGELTAWQAQAGLFRNRLRRTPNRLETKWQRRMRENRDVSIFPHPLTPRSQFRAFWDYLKRGQFRVAIGFLAVGLYAWVVAFICSAWETLAHGIRGPPQGEGNRKSFLRAILDFEIANSQDGLRVSPVFFILPIIGTFVKQSILIHELGKDEAAGRELQAAAFAMPSSAQPEKAKNRTVPIFTSDTLSVEYSGSSSAAVNPEEGVLGLIRLIHDARQPFTSIYGWAATVYQYISGPQELINEFQDIYSYLDDLKTAITSQNRPYYQKRKTNDSAAILNDGEEIVDLLKKAFTRTKGSILADRDKMNQLVSDKDLLSIEEEGDFGEVIKGLAERGLEMLAEDEWNVLDLNAIVEEFRLQHGPDLAGVNLIVENNAADTVIYAKGGYLRRALSNIFTNAATHAWKDLERERIITIRINNSDHRVLLCVEDNGRGLPEDMLREVEDPLNPGKKIPALFITGKSTKTGIGLEYVGMGLSVVRGFVDTHSAKISVQSKLNEGTALVFDLPVYEAEDGGQKATDGYFGNLSPEHLEWLRVNLDKKYIEAEHIEGWPEQFYVITNRSRAPPPPEGLPKYFIFATDPEHIYFSRPELCRMFQEELFPTPEDLALAQEVIRFHERVELETGSHEEACRLTREHSEEYRAIAARIEGFFVATLKAEICARIEALIGNLAGISTPPTILPFLSKSTQELGAVDIKDLNSWKSESLMSLVSTLRTILNTVLRMPRRQETEEFIPQITSILDGLDRLGEATQRLEGFGLVPEYVRVQFLRLTGKERHHAGDADTQGYWGNITQEDINKFAAAFANGEVVPEPVLLEYSGFSTEGRQVKFYKIAYAGHAPPQGLRHLENEAFIFARAAEGGTLNIYFSESALIAIRGEFAGADELGEALRAVAFHEAREIETESHEQAEQETRERYPEIAGRLRRIFLKAMFMLEEREGLRRIEEASAYPHTPMHEIDDIRRRAAFNMSAILMEMFARAGIIRDITFYPLISVDLYWCRFARILGV